MFQASRDTPDLDYVKLLSNSGVLHAHLGAWHDAAEDLSQAVVIAERAGTTPPGIMWPILTNYAHVLRKNHRRREAREVEQRIKALQPLLRSNQIIDVADLLSDSKPGS